MENALEVLLTSLVLMAEDLKKKTDEFRQLLGIRDGKTFPVLHALEHGIGIVDEAFRYQIVDDCDWNDSGIDALYSPADSSCPYRVVYIKASLFARAEEGDMSALFCIAHELCHWFEDFKYGVRVPQNVTHAAARRVMSHIIELYTTVFTYHVFPCDAFFGMERAEQISGSRELDSFMLAYRKFTDWRSSYVTRVFGASRGTEKAAMENARHLSDKSRA